MRQHSFAVICPLANEAMTFGQFSSALRTVLDDMGEGGEVWFVVDGVTKDNTLALCQDLEREDKRFHTVWAPENKNVVDAYIRGYREALASPVDYLLEIDGGLSHDPAAIPQFIRCLSEGHKCAFGSRFINGGSIYDSNWRRHTLSHGGTLLTNLLLGTRMKDMTSGFMGFHRDVVEKFVDFPLRSRAHFYQTEIRYLLRFRQYIEVPIHYMAPSPRVSFWAIRNAIGTLLHYFWLRVTGRSARL